MFFLSPNQSTLSSEISCKLFFFFYQGGEIFDVKALLDLEEISEVIVFNQSPDAGDTSAYLCPAYIFQALIKQWMWGILSHQPGHSDPDSSTVNKSFYLLNGSCPFSDS